MATAGAPLPMPPASAAELATMWAFIKEGVNHIMTKEQTGVGYDSKYRSIYSVIYSYSTSWAVHMGSSKESEMERHLRGFELYDNLNQYFKAHLKNVLVKTDALQDEALLRCYAEQWDRYTTGAYYVNRLFAYLNRHWIKRQRDEGQKGIYPVYALALLQWRNNIFVPVQRQQTKLTSAMLSLIEAQRNGDTIDEGLVKKVVDSSVSLGLDKTNVDKACLDIYKEHFDIPFIAATEKYYRQESESFLAVVLLWLSSR